LLNRERRIRYVVSTTIKSHAQDAEKLGTLQVECSRPTRYFRKSDNRKLSTASASAGRIYNENAKIGSLFRDAVYSRL